MDIDRKISRWIAIWVGWPIALLLVVLNIVLWPHLTHESYAVQLTIRATAIGLSAFLLLIVIYVAGRAAAQGIVGNTTEVLRAGEWVLRNALGKKDIYQDKKVQLAIGARSVEAELEKWFRNVKRDLYDGAVIQTSEMSRDLELAKDFQLAQLNRPYPHVPAVHVEGRLRLIFYHRYEPASALGGDFFDILALGPDTAGVFLSDVMGHGTRSALITAILRTQIRDLAQQGRNARHFMKELNYQFCRMLRAIPNPLFASAFYFLADTTARVATFSSAGHPAPFHLKRGSDRVGQALHLHTPEPRGAALGLIRKEEYSGGHCRLIPGDVFLFFTDGLYEAMNQRGEEFGMGRLNELLRMVMYKGVKDIVDGVMHGVHDFLEGEPVSDDICVVAVEVTDKAEAPEERTPDADVG